MSAVKADVTQEFRKAVHASKPIDAILDASYDTRMIKSVKGSATRQFIDSGKSKFSGMNEEVAGQRIAELNAAQTLDDLGRLNSTGLHKLHGPLKEFWSIDINGRGRLLFRFEKGDAFEVHIDDTH